MSDILDSANDPCGEQLEDNRELFKSLVESFRAAAFDPVIAPEIAGGKTALQAKIGDLRINTMVFGGRVLTTIENAKTGDQISFGGYEGSKSEGWKPKLGFVSSYQGTAENLTGLVDAVRAHFAGAADGTAVLERPKSLLIGATNIKFDPRS